MISDILFGLGFVAIVEGLVLALAPLRLEQLLETIRHIGPDRLRFMGLAVVAIGAFLLWLSQIGDVTPM